MAYEAWEAPSVEHVDSIVLSELREGDLVLLKTNALVDRWPRYGENREIDYSGENAWLYELSIRDRGENPLALMSSTNPEGDQAQAMVNIVGAGRTTTREENPVQKQASGFSLSFGYLYVGGKLVFSTESDGRGVLNDHCTELSIIRADHTGKFATEADIDIAVAALIDRLVNEGKLIFNPNGYFDFTARDFNEFEYQAICEGFGFPPGETPGCHNHLYDDLDNEGQGADEVLRKVDKGDPQLYWHHRVDRGGLEKLLRYWYELGNAYKAAGFKFPWMEDGVTAATYAVMTKTQREELELSLID